MGKKLLYIVLGIAGVGFLLNCCSSDSGTPEPNPTENYAPVASFNATKYSGEAPLKSNLKLSGTDRDGVADIKNYYVKISDLGINISENAPIDTALTFTKPGTYEALGIVQDRSGARDTAKFTLNIKEATKPLEPSISQSVNLEDDVNIKYDVNSQNLSSFELEVYKDSEKILSKTVPEGEHSEVFSYATNTNITKGNYQFVSKFKTNSGKDTTVTSTVEIPNYNPSVDWSSLNVDFEEDGETSVTLPTPNDKNPEDSPEYIQGSFSSNKAELELRENNELNIKGIPDEFGSYTISAEFGSDEGGINSTQVSGEIYELLRLKGRIENNETNEGMLSTFIPYEVMGTDTTRLVSKTADEQGRNLTDNSGNFEIKLNKRKSDLENILLMARKGTPENPEGWVRVQNVGSENFKNILLRAVPYAPYENRKDEFKSFVLETTHYTNPSPFLSRVFDFDGSILRGNVEGFENYSGLKRIRILETDPFTGGTFTKEEQESFKQQILDKGNIGAIIGDYEIKEEQIVFGNDTNLEDYTLHDEYDGILNIQASNGVVVVVPRKNLGASGMASVLLDTPPINSKGVVYIDTEVSNERTFSHEMGHIFLTPSHPSSLLGESIMCKYSNYSPLLPGPADKKLSKITYEKTYLFKADFKNFEMVDYVKNILRDDFK